ncbi:MAG: hypothetical protein ACRD3G_26085 [Vicinamibacterales bacterium]
MRHSCLRVLVVIAFTGLLSSPAATAPVTRFKGLTSGEWTAAWWQAVFALPVESGSHPLITGGAFGGSNRTVFLGAPVVPMGTPTGTIPVTIPPGTSLVVPIITVECSVAEAPPFHGGNEVELRACANGLLDAVRDVYAEIDGKAVKDPGALRVASPLFRYGPLPAGNVLGMPPGTQSDAVGAGYNLLLQPFSVGVHRVIIRANVPDFGIAVDTEFLINVEPR